VLCPWSNKVPDVLRVAALGVGGPWELKEVGGQWARPHHALLNCRTELLNVYRVKE